MPVNSSKPPSGRQRRRAPLVASRPSGRGDDGRRKGSGPAPASQFEPPPRPPAGLDEDDGEWMTQRRAADAAGVSLEVIRRWRKEGTIAERRSPGGGGLQVFLTPGHQAPDAAAETGPPVSELGVLVPLEVHQRSLAELILRLTDTTERAVQAETEVRFLRERLAELERRS